MGVPTTSDDAVTAAHHEPQADATAAPLGMANTAPASLPAELLLTFLRTNDAACPICQYNLRHLTEPRCPECGREVCLTVGMTEPFILPWVFTTTFVAMAASIGVLLGMVMVFVGLPPPEAFAGAGLRVVPLVVGAGYGVLALPLTLLLLVARRPFWRMHRKVQIGFAVAAFIINTILLLGGFAVLVRI